MGWTLAAMCVAEVPTFFFTGSILKWLGINTVLHCLLGALALRSFAYTAAPFFGGPLLAPPVRPLWPDSDLQRSKVIYPAPLSYYNFSLPTR